MGPVKQICVFEHSVMTNFNCACLAIQRGQGSGFLSEGSSWLTACMSEQRRFWWDCADAHACLNLRYLHRREVSNSLDAAHILLSNNFCHIPKVTSIANTGKQTMTDTNNYTPNYNKKCSIISWTPLVFSASDINECATGKHRCYSNQRCVNTDPGYRCLCPRGYVSAGPGTPCLGKEMKRLMTMLYHEK